MNKQEFLEMKDEFALIIYNYEKFLKDCVLLDYKYNDHFYELLQKIGTVHKKETYRGELVVE